MLCKLNHDVLNEIYGSRFKVFELAKQPVSGLRSIFRAFKGHIDGINEQSIEKIIQAVNQHEINKVFVDGSNLGGIVEALKKRIPEIHVFTFFHNVEARFFWGSLTRSKSLRALAVLAVNYLAERKSIRYSDHIVCMNERDSSLLRKVYGRGATDISPMSLFDDAQQKIEADIGIDEPFALFVGGGFYANVDGIAWYVEKVAPHVNIKTRIVGRGLEAFRNKLELPGKVELIGEVEHLGPWYHEASIVIAPIFDGSGMKTKVAEALKYGKRVIGTQEAFVGYEAVVESAGIVCHSAGDFIQALNAELDVNRDGIDEDLRHAFEDHYSFQAAKGRFSRIIYE